MNKLWDLSKQHNLEPLEIKWEILLIALVGLLLSMGLFFFVPRAMVLGEGLLVFFFGYVLWKGIEKNKATNYSSIALKN